MAWRPDHDEDDSLGDAWEPAGRVLQVGELERADDAEARALARDLRAAGVLELRLPPDLADEEMDDFMSALQAAVGVHPVDLGETLAETGGTRIEVTFEDAGNGDPGEDWIVDLGGGLARSIETLFDRADAVFDPWTLPEEFTGADEDIVDMGPAIGGDGATVPWHDATLSSCDGDEDFWDPFGPKHEPNGNHDGFGSWGSPVRFEYGEADVHGHEGESHGDETLWEEASPSPLDRVDDPGSWDADLPSGGFLEPDEVEEPAPPTWDEVHALFTADGPSIAGPADLPDVGEAPRGVGEAAALDPAAPADVAESRIDELDTLRDEATAGTSAGDAPEHSMDDAGQHPAPEGSDDGDGPEDVLEKDHVAGPDELRFPTPPEPAVEATTRTDSEVDLEDRRMPDLPGRAREYLVADPPERRAIAQELREWAARHQDLAALGPVAESVAILALGVDGEGWSVPSALTLARELATPSVANLLVAKLGSEREEERRAEYVKLFAAIPHEIAPALADALAEAGNRSTRRLYVDAIIALGDTGRALAGDMIEDSRWFVVRNGVAILGEVGGVGGKDAIVHLVSTLAHEDPRVRREAIGALTKLGGESAGMLALGMLEDPDPDVRCAAVLSVGLMKVERALKPLLKRLDEEDDDDLHVECLRALGRLGDPGAVPAIEKKAVPSLFSRPSRQVRVAAYQALAAIGTPHAQKLLEQAAHDKDTEIRYAVRALSPDVG